MIERDRKLLARLARFNKHLGSATLELFEYQDGSELPAAGVRNLGQHLVELGADFLARAAELDGPTIDRGIIDAQPT